MSDDSADSETRKDQCGGDGSTTFGTPPEKRQKTEAGGSKEFPTPLKDQIARVASPTSLPYYSDTVVGKEGHQYVVYRDVVDTTVDIETKKVLEVIKVRRR
jgi:hypothetical protein